MLTVVFVSQHIAILTGSQLMLNLGFSQMVPVIPLFAAQMGGHLGATGIGLVISAPSLATLLLNVPLGRLCDKVGRKPLMWMGAGLTAIGTCATGFSGSLATVLPCRLLVGAGSASSLTGSSAYLADLSDQAPQHRAKIMGIVGMVAGSVWIVGPAVGGWLAEEYGYQNSFIIAGLGAALCSLGYTQLPETLAVKKEAEVEPGTAKRTWKEEFVAWKGEMAPILASRNQQALIAFALVPAFRWSCFASVVALHATQTIDAGPKEIGLMFSTLALSQGIGMPLGSYLADDSKYHIWTLLPYMDV